MLENASCTMHHVESVRRECSEPHICQACHNPNCALAPQGNSSSHAEVQVVLWWVWLQLHVLVVCVLVLLEVSGL